MIYDDASWHHGEDFPRDLSLEAATTHAGMFLAWALFTGLGGDHRRVDSPDEVECLRARKLTPVLDRRLANWRRGRPADASPVSPASSPIGTVLRHRHGSCAPSCTLTRAIARSWKTPAAWP